jgi:ubiquinone/menaquinone biosynthesis C-methylase UbiE
MDHFRNIYQNKAQEYHDMISPEDTEENLNHMIESIVSLKGKTLLDIGSGTGRIPLFFSREVGECIAIDLYFPMLQVQQQEQTKINGNWSILNADNRSIPIGNDFADIISAGWAIGHLRDWYKNNWKKEIGKILKEMERVAKPGATLLIMETLTTGGFKPSPPTKELAEYYNWLEAEWGYKREVISTDFQYATIEEAINKTEFFFGTELSDNIQSNKWDRIPEWTGVWHKKI